MQRSRTNNKLFPEMQLKGKQRGDTLDGWAPQYPDHQDPDQDPQGLRKSGHQTMEPLALLQTRGELPCRCRPDARLGIRQLKSQCWCG